MMVWKASMPGTTGYPEDEPCSMCRGEGKVWGVDCGRCNGTGKRNYLQENRNRTLRDAAPVPQNDPNWDDFQPWEDQHGLTNEERMYIQQNLALPRADDEGFDEVWQQKNAGEPMEIAMRLLKGERKLEYGVYVHPADPKAMGVAGPMGGGRWAIGPTPKGIGLDARLASTRIKDNRWVLDPDFGEETTRRFAEKQVPRLAHEVGHALDSQWGEGSFAQQEMPAHVLEMATREAMKLREGKYPQEPIIPKARDLLLDRLYPGGRVIREGGPSYTTQTSEDNPDYQYDVTDDTITSGEPMDLAMRLLKTPLLPESINEVDVGGISGSQYYTADFEHPETGEIYPMQGYSGDDEAGTYIYPPGKKPMGGLSGGAIGSSYFGPNHDSPNTQEWIGAPVIPDREGSYEYPEGKSPPAGMGTAMYDLAAMMADKRGAKIVPSPSRSHQAQQMWAKHEDKGHWPVKTGEPMDIAWQLLKAALFTPKSGYKEEDDYPKRAPHKPPSHKPGHHDKYTSGQQRRDFDRKHFFNRVGVAGSELRGAKFRESLPNFPFYTEDEEGNPVTHSVQSNAMWPSNPGEGGPSSRKAGRRYWTKNEMRNLLIPPQRRPKIFGEGTRAESDEQMQARHEQADKLIEQMGLTQRIPQEGAGARQEMRPGWQHGAGGRKEETAVGDEAWDKMWLPEGMFDIPEEEA